MKIWYNNETTKVMHMLINDNCDDSLFYPDPIPDEISSAVLTTDNEIYSAFHGGENIYSYNSGTGVLTAVTPQPLVFFEPEADPENAWENDDGVPGLIFVDDAQSNYGQWYRFEAHPSSSTVLLKILNRDANIAIIVQCDRGGSNAYYDWINTADDQLWIYIQVDNLAALGRWTVAIDTTNDIYHSNIAYEQGGPDVFLGTAVDSVTNRLMEEVDFTETPDEIETDFTWDSTSYSYTLNADPTSVKVYKNGVRLFSEDFEVWEVVFPLIGGTLTGKGVKFTVPPDTGDVLKAEFFRKGSGENVYPSINDQPIGRTIGDRPPPEITVPD